ncbi:sigma-70 family RNA polymerase sigma factor [Niveibacterium sp. COAC-50]|uniref:sigma-70 family RNA polymerase sigma factor n=1 Tax=Niveibacterium sp. COAC-50 TaxID=2729384 RepID=UPI00155608F0|nr:sigma-70 family RNA polymerase sigma factor [Niveibacterium sp. COAC-50]
MIAVSACATEDVHANDAGESASALAVQHLDLVRILAAKLYRRRWSEEVPFDDYLQSGMVGLLEAAHRFDPRQGTSFASFASPRVTGAIIDSLADATERNCQLATARRLRQERAANLADTQDTRDDSAEGALARIAEIVVDLAVGFMLEDSPCFRDGTETVEPQGYASAATRQAREQLRAAFAQLDERRREIIERHYFQHETFSDIAQTMQLTRSRIAQLHREALSQLRQHLHPALSDFAA